MFYSPGAFKRFSVYAAHIGQSRSITVEEVTPEAAVACYLERAMIFLDEGTEISIRVQADGEDAEQCFRVVHEDQNSAH